MLMTVANKRHTASRLAALLLAALGCTAKHTTTESVWVPSPAPAATNAHCDSAIQLASAQEPLRTVLDPGGAVEKKISLADAIRMALANNRQVATLGFDPGRVGTAVEQQRSVFDPIVEAGGGWGRTRNQLIYNLLVLGTNSTQIGYDTFGNIGGLGGFGYNLTNGAGTEDNPSRSYPGGHMFAISKRNITGGTTFASYDIDYYFQQPVSPIVTLVNPAWLTRVGVAVEQPILQGAGADFNRAPILIARANEQQAIHLFQREVHQLVRDVEREYWQLYFAYQNLHAHETGMAQSLLTWQNERQQLAVGSASAPDVAQALEQYEFFRAARMEALIEVISAERRLRELLGMKPDGAERLIPTDQPLYGEYEPDWRLGVAEGLQQRPELAAQRAKIRAAELDVLRQRNGLLPDLTANASYGLNGVGASLGQATDFMTSNQFPDWHLSVRLKQQVGERSAHAGVRRAKLALGQERARLEQHELAVTHQLYEALQQIIARRELVRIQRRRRVAASQLLDAQANFHRRGETTLDVLLGAQSKYVDALRDEARAVVVYNQALADWDYARGAILDRHQVQIFEDRVEEIPDKHAIPFVRRGLPEPPTDATACGELPFEPTPEAIEVITQ